MFVCVSVRFNYEYVCVCGTEGRLCSRCACVYLFICVSVGAKLEWGEGSQCVCIY